MVDVVEHLAANEPDISLWSRWRPKTKLEESEYWTPIHQVVRIKAPNDYFIIAACVDKQLFTMST